MDWMTILGTVAAVLTTTSFVPQLIRIWKTKSTKDLSTGTYVMFCTGIFLWLVYGILIKNIPIILANSITFVLVAMILGLKIKYR